MPIKSRSRHTLMHPTLGAAKVNTLTTLNLLEAAAYKPRICDRAPPSECPSDEVPNQTSRRYTQRLATNHESEQYLTSNAQLIVISKLFPDRLGLVENLLYLRHFNVSTTSH